MRCARSSATQHISLENVKCRAPPRTSQIPSSGRVQFSQTQSASARSRIHVVCEIGRAWRS
jgi:hypothetical protein